MNPGIEVARAAIHKLEAERARLLDRRDVSASERRLLAVAAAAGDAEASRAIGELRASSVELDRRFAAVEDEIELAHPRLEQVVERSKKMEAAEWEREYLADEARRKAQRVRKRTIAALHESVQSIFDCDASPAEKRELVAETVRQAREFLSKAFDVPIGDDAADDVSEDLLDKVVQMHGGRLSRAEALTWLRSTTVGKKEVHRTANKHGATMSNTEKTIEAFRKERIAKLEAMDIVAVAKAALAAPDENILAIDESEFCELITATAKREHPSLSRPQAFSRLYCEQSERGVLLRRAAQVVKACEFSALVSDGSASLTVRGDDVDVEDAQAALAQLAEIGAQKWPDASSDVQFARAFEAPENVQLAKRAHRRPTGHPSYYPAR